VAAAATLLQVAANLAALQFWKAPRLRLMADCSLLVQAQDFQVLGLVISRALGSQAELKLLRSDLLLQDSTKLLHQGSSGEASVLPAGERSSMEIGLVVPMEPL
jgi:hypothetical protein